MASVTSLGSGSGLDLNGLLSSLMAAEQRPLQALQVKEASYQATISAYGSLKGALSALQASAAALVPATGISLATKFETVNTSVADTSIAYASGTSSAVAGSYSLEVTALAQNQRLTSPDNTLTNKASNDAMAASLAKGGSLKIELGSLSGAYAYTADSTRELNITVAAGSTLEQVRDSINAAATDGRVSATLINGTNGQQLVLTSGLTGTANVMKLTGDSNLGTGLDFDPSGSSSGSGSLSQAAANGGQPAIDAAFKLGGIAATSSTNTVTGVLDGVTLTLSKLTAAATPTTLTVSKNQTAGLTSALNAFIKSYNDANTTMTSQGAYNATTKAAGSLLGDSTLRSAQNRVRNLLFNTKPGGDSAYQLLSDIGVSVAKDGSLSLDSTKLNTAIGADFNGVASLVSTVGKAYNDSIDDIVGSTGSITTATDSTNRLIKSVTDRAQVMSDRLTGIEARYRAQFTALDTMISGMKQTSSYLTTQLANLSSLTIAKS